MSNWKPILSRRWPGARLVAEQPLAGDASTRRYVRLHLEGGDAPPTAIAMLLPARTPADGVEIPFLDIQRHLEGLGVAVPALYAAHDRDRGLLLLEDVGDRPLAGVLADPATSRAEAQRLLGDVATMLATLVAAPPTPACIAWTRSHDETLLRRELDMVLSYALAPSDAGPPRPVDADPEARARLERLGAALAVQPRRLMHRDFHAWNLHVDAAGRLRVIDFQDAMLGPPTYDLASFCADRESDAFVGPVREAFLLDRYADALAQMGVDLYTDRDMLRRDFHTSVVFRALRVIGRFRVLAIDHGDQRYLHYIPRMAQRARQALETLDDRPLAALLASRSGYFA